VDSSGRRNIDRSDDVSPAQKMLAGVRQFKVLRGRLWAITLFGSGDDHVTCARRRVARGGWVQVGQDDRGVHLRALMRFCRSSLPP